jgi:hypothetical protein
LRAIFDPENTIEVELYFTGGNEIDPKDETESFENEVSETKKKVLYTDNCLLTKITVELYSLNLSDFFYSVLHPNLSYVLELNLRNTKLVPTECIVLAK